MTPARLRAALGFLAAILAAMIEDLLDPADPEEDPWTRSP